MRKIFFLVKKLFSFFSVSLVIFSCSNEQKSVSTLLSQKSWTLLYSNHKTASKGTVEDVYADKKPTLIFKSNGTGTSTGDPKQGDISGDLTWSLTSDSKLLTVKQGDKSLYYTIAKIDELTLNLVFTGETNVESDLGPKGTVVTWEKAYTHPDFNLE